MSTPIKYIGHRPTYTEGAYGSGLVFTQGQTLNIEDDVLARKLLRHADVYVRGDAESAEKTIAEADTNKKQGDKDEDQMQVAKDALVTMTKDSLKTYAKTHFNVDLDSRKSVGDLRTQVSMLLDQFGLE